MGKKPPFRKIKHCLKTLSDGGVVSNSDLKGENNRRINGYGICYEHDRNWSTCICNYIDNKGRKTDKHPKRKRGSRRGLQGRVIHCSVLKRDGGIGLQVGFNPSNNYSNLI